MYHVRCAFMRVTYWFGLDFFGIEGLEELRVPLQFQALLCYSEVSHPILCRRQTCSQLGHHLHICYFYFYIHPNCITANTANKC